MNEFRIFAVIFITVAIILSNIMCANVDFEYCNQLWGIKYAGYSAGAYVVFFITIPYAAGILFCTIFSDVYWRKSKNFPSVVIRGYYVS